MTPGSWQKKSPSVEGLFIGLFEIDSLETALHQLTHQVTAALLETGEFVGLQASDGQAGHLIEVTAEVVRQFLTGAGAGSRQDRSGGELDQALDQAVLAVHQ